MKHPYREAPPMKRMVRLDGEEIKKAIGHYVTAHGLLRDFDPAQARMAYHAQVVGNTATLVDLTYWVEEEAP